MTDVHSFRCTCGNRAKNLLHSPDSSMLAKCGRCARDGKPGVVSLSSVALTPELIEKIEEDTFNAANNMTVRPNRSAIIAKASPVIALYSQMKPKEEAPIPHQQVDTEEARMDHASYTRSQKWKHIPYGALLRVFEYLGEWGNNRVSKRWYDAFMNYNFKLEISTVSLGKMMDRSARNNNISIPGWNQEHALFWRKYISCHTELIGTTTAQTAVPHEKLGRLLSHNHITHIYKWLGRYIIRPLFVIRDKQLYDHIISHCEDNMKIKNWLKREFRATARIFYDLYQLPVFLEKYGFLMTELQLETKILTALISTNEDDE